MEQNSVNDQKNTHFSRFVDYKQSEVKWGFIVSVFFMLLLIHLPLHENFLEYQDMVSDLIECIISGLIGLIGVGIAVITIVITLFSAEQIKIINEVQPGAFEKLLYSFQWFVLIASLEIAVFAGMLFILKSSYPVIHKILFYIVTFLLTYGVFYLLFYGYALVKNVIQMAKIKYSLDNLEIEKTQVPIHAIEIELDFLVAKLVKGDLNTAKAVFYSELLDRIEKSSMDDKKEILQYFQKRYFK